MKNPLVAVVLSFLLISCNDSPKISNNTDFFDFKKLFQDQIVLLNKRHSKVLKCTSFNKSRFQKPQVLTVDWQKELELFLQLDLNKPAFKMSYDSLSTETLKVYKLKKGEALPLKYIVLSENANSTKIQAKIKVSNMLYESEKTLNATFEKGLLSSYKVDGFQEIVFLPRSYYGVSAETQK